MYGPPSYGPDNDYRYGIPGRDPALYTTGLMLVEPWIPPSSPYLRPFPRVMRTTDEFLQSFYISVFMSIPEDAETRRRAFRNIVEAAQSRIRRSSIFKLFRFLDHAVFCDALGRRLYLTWGDGPSNRGSEVSRIQPDRVQIVMNERHAVSRGARFYWGRFIHALTHALIEIWLGRAARCGGEDCPHEVVFYGAMCIINDYLNGDGRIIRLCQLDNFHATRLKQTWYPSFKHHCDDYLHRIRGNGTLGYGFGGYNTHESGPGYGDYATFNSAAFNNHAFDIMPDSAAAGYADSDSGSSIGYGSNFGDDPSDFNPSDAFDEHQGHSGYATRDGHSTDFSRSRGERTSGGADPSASHSGYSGHATRGGFPASFSGSRGASTSGGSFGGHSGTERSTHGARTSSSRLEASIHGPRTSSSYPESSTHWARTSISRPEASTRGSRTSSWRGGEFGAGSWPESTNRGNQSGSVGFDSSAGGSSRRGSFRGGFQGGFSGGEWGGNFGGGRFPPILEEPGKLDINPYKVLGVSRSAAQAEIKKAFRKLAQENHPDKIKGATKEKEAAGKRMADINRAHDILSNEQKKKQYDETGGVRTERAR